MLGGGPVKTCIRCGLELPHEAFAMRDIYRDGYESACKRCELERVHYWKHCMTTLDKSDRAEAQGGCALCDRVTPGRKGWVLDHDRSCCPGDRSCEFCRRAVLCQWCNTALGYAGDNPATLRRMADYIETGTRIA